MGLARRLALGAVWGTIALHGGWLRGQTAADGGEIYSAPATTGEDVLREMSARAAVIFVGTVTAVRKASDEELRSGSGGAVAEVDFAVESGVRGAAAGSVYAMREWAGMWRDSPRFTVGQRLLMLLYAPGPGGLSSPVDGLDGAIPIRGGDAASTAQAGVSVQGAQVAAADAPAGQDTVDLRWLQAKTLRAQAVVDAPVAGPGVSVVGGLSVAPVAVTSVAVGGFAASATASSGGAVTAGLGRVLGLLTAWQKERSAAR